MSGDPKIRGYRNLSDNEITKINVLKVAEQQLSDQLRSLSFDLPEGGPRHMALARTYFEIAFFFAIKAIAQPTGGFGDASSRDGVGTGGG